MMSRLRNEESGFTLLEAIVASAILVVAFVALATIFIGGQNQASADVQQSQMINAADQQIEQVRALATSTPNGFAALAVTPDAGATLSADLTPAAKTPDRSTWLYPTQFAYAGSSTEECYEIDSDYDNVSLTATGPSGGVAYGAQPSGFVQWSDCGTMGEPVETVASSGLITLESSASHACALGSGAQPSTVYSPCSVQLGGSQYNVYTIVTDTYIGCGASGATGESCPVLSNGVVQASAANCGATSVTTGTFATTAALSDPCADARRVTVAVVPVSTVQANTKLARDTPVYLSAIITNPQPSGSQQSGGLGTTLGATL